MGHRRWAMGHGGVGRARLPPEGRTNQEIADALVLSVRTVENHLAHVYAKAGARGRAEPIAYAFRQGLTQS